MEVEGAEMQIRRLMRSQGPMAACPGFYGQSLGSKSHWLARETCPPASNAGRHHLLLGEVLKSSIQRTIQYKHVE